MTTQIAPLPPIVGHFPTGSTPTFALVKIAKSAIPIARALPKKGS